MCTFVIHIVSSIWGMHRPMNMSRPSLPPAPGTRPRAHVTDPYQWLAPRGRRPMVPGEGGGDTQWRQIRIAQSIFVALQHAKKPIVCGMQITCFFLHNFQFLFILCTFFCQMFYSCLILIASKYFPISHAGNRLLSFFSAANGPTTVAPGG